MNPVQNNLRRPLNQKIQTTNSKTPVNSKKITVNFSSRLPSPSSPNEKSDIVFTKVVTEQKKSNLPQVVGKGLDNNQVNQFLSNVNTKDRDRRKRDREKKEVENNIPKMNLSKNTAGKEKTLPPKKNVIPPKKQLPSKQSTTTLSKNKISSTNVPINKGPNKVLSKAVIRPSILLSLDDHHKAALQALDKLSTKLKNLNKSPENEKKQRENLSYLKLKIQKIVEDKKLTTEECIIELSIISFYINRAKEIPLIEGSLAEYRLSEMQTLEAEYYNKHRNTFEGDIRKLCTGAMRYFLTACIGMVLQPPGTFHMGGCMALKMFLSKKSAGFLISPENRDLFLHLLDHLQKNPNLIQSLLHKFDKGFPNFSKEIIEKDLKINVEPTSFHAQIALFLAICSLETQFKEGNCYSVANLNIKLKQEPEKIVKMGISILKNNGYLFDGVLFSTKLLLESRCFNEDDLGLHLTAQDDPSQIQVLKSAMALLNIKTSIPSKNQTLQEVIENNFPNSARGIKKIIGSFTSNSLLREAILNALRVYMINAPESKTNAFSVKDALLAYIFYSFFERSCNAYPALRWLDAGDVTYFKRRIKEKLNKNFYFIAYNYSNEKIENNRVCYEYHSQGLAYNGKLEDYKKCRENTRLFRCTEDNNLIPIDKISELKKQFLGMIKEVCDQANLDFKAKSKQPDLQDPEDMTLLANHVTEYLNSSDFDKDCALMLEQINKKNVSLAPSVYLNADSLFIVSRGADSRAVFGWGNEFVAHSSSAISPIIKKFSSTNTKGFLISLFDSYRELYQSNPNYFDTLPNPSLLLVIKGEHGFIGSPNHTREFWDKATLSTIEKIEEMETRGKNILKSCNLDTQQRILEEFFEKKEDENNLLTVNSIINSIDETTSMEEFRALVLAKISSTEKNEFDEIFNYILNQISFQDILAGSSTILTLLKISDPETCKTMQQEINTLQKISNHFTPYELAQNFQSIIIKLSLPYIELHVLEKVFADYFNIPQVLDGGILNWVEKLTENPSFQHWVFVFEYSTKEWECYVRSDKTIVSLNADLKSAMLRRFWVQMN